MAPAAGSQPVMPREDYHTRVFGSSQEGRNGSSVATPVARKGHEQGNAKGKWFPLPSGYLSYSLEVLDRRDFPPYYQSVSPNLTYGPRTEGLCTY